MPKITDLTLVTVENVHEVIPAFIIEKQILISSYEDMVDVVLEMVKNKHVFNMDRELLRTIMEDLTYMYCPGDDINKERVMGQLEASDDEDEEDELDEDDDIEDIPPHVKVDTLVSDIED
tara:strand:+ start:1091 stop:1450 length:360 start_codon:yes stop_codon:yes gene_type:complete